jgi:O-antigen/teichoic acid export membrane protein
MWLIGANMIARLSGMVILILIGHAYSQADLGTYFQMLAMIGLAVTATQAGSGPLLVRLAQRGAFEKAALTVATRFVIAGIASLLIIATTSLPLAQYWPLILIPFAAALSPDWIISAKTRFSRLGMIAVLAQACGIMVAVWAARSHSHSALYLIAPAVSLASLALATTFAFEKSPSDLTTPKVIGDGSTFGLVGFTLLAGFVPNLDFVLLAANNDPLFLAQRIFLFCAGLIAAIAATLFAKNEAGHLRDIWLLAPMAFISGLLLLFPGTLADLFYATPSENIVNLLQIGAAWPVLPALLTRQILILQETPAVRWLGWGSLALMVISASAMPVRDTAIDTMMLIEFRLACLVLIMFASQKVMTRRQFMA